MKFNKIVVASVIAGTLVFSGNAFATKGGEGNNTGCNGVGNPNSPCQPSTNPPGNGGGGGNGGNGGSGGAGGDGGNGTGVGIGVGVGGNAAGGAGGNASAAGGNGGAGGSAVGTGGNGTGGNAAGGNASGGNASAAGTGGNATGGNSSANGGNANSGGNTMVGGTMVGGTNNARGGEGGSANLSDSGNSASSANNSGGNSTTNVDTSDRSTSNFSYTYVPPVVPSTPPSVLAGANVVTQVGTCGPLQTVVRTPVKGTFFGLTGKSSVDLGYDETLQPFVNASGDQVFYREVRLPDGSVRLMGHQPVFFTTVIGVSGSRNLALGGGSDGDWGQAGGGASSSMQQLVTRVILRECDAGTLVPAKPVYVEVPVKRVAQ